MILTENPQNVKTSIRYNRSDKTWQAVNGTVTNCASKNEALMVALTHDHPRIAAKVGDIIRLHGQTNDITSRAIKAAQLIVKGHVAGNAVRSQTQPDTVYNVRFDGLPGTYKCDCPDNRIDDPMIGEICKHTLAVHIDYLAR